MYKLYKKQEQNITQKIKERTKNLTESYKIQKIEERNLYNFLKNGFPINRSVLFFDDMLENIEETNLHSRRIIPVYLPFEEVFIFKHFDIDQSFEDVKSKFKNNNYVTRMTNRSMMKSDGITNKYTTVDDELLPTIEQRLYDWVLQTENHKQRYAFFDWDFTLNVYGGFKLIDRTVKTMDDTLLVLLGGKERLENIRNILQFLITHNIKIYIITANPQADENNELFVILLQRLMGKQNFTHQQLVYANTYITPKYKLIHEIITKHKTSTQKVQKKNKNKTEKQKRL
tara:strand:+ start:1122 stop:1979 length:858 start_codon:yes stop_codon:yes gene_type:complete